MKIKLSLLAGLIYLLFAYVVVNAQDSPISKSYVTSEDKKGTVAFEKGPILGVHQRTLAFKEGVTTLDIEESLELALSYLRDQIDVTCVDKSLPQILREEADAIDKRERDIEFIENVLKIMKEFNNEYK